MDNETKKQCPHCKEDINIAATRCHHCQAPVGKKWNWKPYIFVNIVVIVIIAAFSVALRHETYATTCEAQTSISYSISRQVSRESDVRGIPIKECYIILEKLAPSIAELTQFANEVGRDKKNIEFFIYDDPRAYEIDITWNAAAQDSDIPKKDREFDNIHYLANYLKANTYLTNNSLQPVSDIYRATLDSDIPQISIYN